MQIKAQKAKLNLSLRHSVKYEITWWQQIQNSQRCQTVNFVKLLLPRAPEYDMIDVNCLFDSYPSIYYNNSIFLEFIISPKQLQWRRILFTSQ